MTESTKDAFEQGYERYQAGENPASLIPLFKEICDRAPRNSAAWTSLAWLYLLTDQPKKALKAAQKATKLEPAAPQSRINLVLAMLETGEKGVRQHIEKVQEIMLLDAQIRQDLAENIADGLNRKPNWQSLIRVKKWLFE
ncbi:MAG: hypothetical protein D6756_04740 [Cyanobacteria bacterium J083]|nr:MAG: hypothetical protein D6756_04740 [Cyanobacteria bacterium J083]